MENQLSIALSKNKLLKNVDISSINFSGIKGKLITAGEGEILYREGDNSNAIFIVISGEINLIKKRLLGKTKSFIFLEDDFFGNEEYFEETARTSTAVALRDSYLISLADDEIENLVNQEHQIYLNLREPVEEAEEDSSRLPQKPGTDESKITTKLQSKKSKINPFKKADEDFKKQQNNENDFFKSIADVSRSEETDSIIETANKDFELLSFEEDEIGDSSEQKNVLEHIKEINGNETGFDNKVITPSENIDSEREKPAFDESAFLNEDGIPKAEFELPDQTEYSQIKERKTHDLDDALFNILSGGDTFENSHYNFNNADARQNEDKNIPGDKENAVSAEEKLNDDNDFFAAFSSDKHEIFDVNGSVNSFNTEMQNDYDSAGDNLELIKDTAQFEIEQREDEQQHEQIKAKSKPEDEQVTQAQPYKKNFNNEDILAEADEKLRKIERGEPVKNTDNWRTIGSNSNEMTPDQLQMIIKAAEFVNSAVKIDEVLKNVVEVATNLTNSDRGTLFLIDREKNELWSLVAMGSESKELRLKVGEGLAGFVALSGEVINIKDVQKDTRFRQDFDKASGYKTKNMLCYPIKNNKHEIIGVLQLLNSKHGEFSKLDENFLNAISIHSAIALQNAALVDKLLQSERVQSLGKMANFLIQDIKKPVLVSRRYAEHLKSKNLSQDVIQVIDMLLEQLNQVADLVQTTSSYSEGKPVLRTLNVSLNNTLADYCSRISGFIESRKCNIITEYDKDVTVKLDVKEFYQCFVHIVKNACDAMPDGGEINLYTKRDDRRIKIYFRDSGFGIPDGFKEKIFEPFMSYGKKEGTGLGLSITKKVIEAHNGSINVESTLGQGSTFVIDIPVAATF